MDVEPSCVMCDTNIEDGGHLFFKCKKVKELWAMMQIEEQRSVLAQISSAKEVSQYVLKQKTKEMVKIFTLLRAWWSEWNTVREGSKPTETWQIERNVEGYTAEIMHTMTKKSSQTPRQHHI
jgi:hypothetical protein